METRKKQKKSQAIFVDDDLNFIKTIQTWQKDVEMEELATDDVTESLKWVKEGKADVFVCDLKGIDGVSVLEQVADIAPQVKLILLTAYEPSENEMRRLENINVKILFKISDLKSFLKSLSKGETTYTSQFLIDLQTRLTILETINREWVDDLIEQLEAIPNLEKSWVSCSDEPFTVEQLIHDIKNLNPRGIKHIRLWRKVQKTIRTKKGGKS